MDNINTSIQGQNPWQNPFFSPISLSQTLTVTSNIDIVLPTSQSQVLFPYGILAEIPIDPIVSNPDLKIPRR
jgi:hypothetical protein